MVNTMETKDLPIYGPERSASGTENAYYLPSCPHAGHRPAYCSCLDKIARRKKGRLVDNPDCSAAIGNKSCPALAMRHEEELAGKAIYFISRKQLQEEMKIAADARAEVFSRMAERGKNWAPSRTKRPSTAPAKPAAATPPAVDYAAAINQALANAKAAAAAAPTAPESKIELKTGASSALKSVSADLPSKQSAAPTTGMSMKEFAAQIARQRAAAAAAAIAA